MRISVVGTGYVGLTTTVGFASRGHDVTCLDIDKKKVESLRAGRCPIYEPGLGELLSEAIKAGRFRAESDPSCLAESDLIFICVGTPSKEDGSIDLTQLRQASEDIARNLGGEYPVIVVKSTVVPGTTESTVIPTVERISGRKAGKGFGVCVNPEFLREGRALEDFLHPDRVVVGELTRREGNMLERLYRDFGCPILRTNLRTAEMIKYASNAFLAARVSLINEIGNLCKLLGIDTKEVARGVGLDKRIGPHFLSSGIGFGGSCFPKDVKALIARGREMGYEMKILRAVLEVNEDQPLRLIPLLEKHLGRLEGKRIGVLGLAFKPDTDDVREAPSLKVVSHLLRMGAKVRAYDPKAADNFKKYFPNIEYCASARAVLDSDAVLILTEWQEFEKLDYSGKIVVDGRGVEAARKTAKAYEGVCW
jgi:UDPglucose 6-dehydrogenase